MDQINNCRLREIREAASALGIDPDTLSLGLRAPITVVPEPELEAPRLTDREWELLAPIIPRKSRYLSKIDPRAFIDACLCLAMYDFKFRLVPTPGFNVEAFRAKFYRSCLAGVFAELTVAAAGPADVVSAENTSLLAALRDAEERYVERHQKIVEDARLQLARAYANPHEPR